MMMTELTPKGRSPLVRLFVDYNPFYIVSAMCMLFGVFAINGSLDWSPIPVRNLLIMIATLNVYEIALIGLAIFLLKLNVRRDGLLLMVIEAFFLADVGFLNMEVFAVDYRLGMAVNAVVLVAAVVKLAVLLHAAGVPLWDGRFAFITIELAVLFAVPGIFAVVAQPRHDVLPPLTVFAGWWLAGFLPVAFVMSVGSFESFARPALGWLGTARILARVLIVLPMLSLLAHLCLANWVYKVAFHPSNVAPLLLGMAVAVARIDRHMAPLLWRMRMALAMPFVAVALAAIKFPQSMVLDAGGWALSPLRLVLIAATLVYLDAAWLFRMAHFAVAAAFCVIGTGLGHNVAAINDNSIAAGRWWIDGMKKLVPTTVRQWGIYSIAASFVLLLLGLAVSLLRHKPAEQVATDAA